MTNTMTARTAPAWASAWTCAAIEALPVDITTATPPQVDEMIRTVDLDRAGFEGAEDRAVVAIRWAIGQESTERREGYGRARRTVTEWPTDAAEAVATARAMDPATTSAYSLHGFRGAPDTVGEAVAALDAVLAQAREAAMVADEGRAEFARRGGWSRFYIVNNSNGHVHTSTACRETYATTQWCWPTELSGQTDAQVVEFAGSLGCLTCFPAYRAEIEAGRPPKMEAFETPEQTAARVEREAEAAAKLAAKIAKGVTADGKPLVVDLGRHNLIGFGRTLEVKTERAAELRYVELAAMAQTRRSWVTADDKAVARSGADALADALAWKRGTDRAAQIAKLAPKVERKVATDW